MPEHAIHRDELSSASPWFSPGLVRDSEVVLRTIFDPHHLQDGKLSTAAIALKDLKSRGWSVDRKRFTSPWRIRIFHWQWKHRKADIHTCFVIPIDVQTLRSHKADQKQLFSATDDALLLNPAHAAVLLSAQCGDGAARRARDMLIRQLPAHVDPSSAFSSEDTWGWSRGVLLEVFAIVRQTFVSVKVAGTKK